MCVHTLINAHKSSSEMVIFTYFWPFFIIFINSFCILETSWEASTVKKFWLNFSEKNWDTGKVSSTYLSTRVLITSILSSDRCSCFDLRIILSSTNLKSILKLKITSTIKLFLLKKDKRNYVIWKLSFRWNFKSNYC